MLLSPSLVQHINTEHTKVNGVKTDCSFSFNLHQFSFSIHFSIWFGFRGTFSPFCFIKLKLITYISAL